VDSLLPVVACLTQMRKKILACLAVLLSVLRDSARQGSSAEASFRNKSDASKDQYLRSAFSAFALGTIGLRPLSYKSCVQKGPVYLGTVVLLWELGHSVTIQGHVQTEGRMAKEAGKPSPITACQDGAPPINPS
jgi:hypothetical protein